MNKHKQFELLNELDAALTTRRNDFEVKEEVLKSVGLDDTSPPITSYYLIDTKLKLKWNISDSLISLENPFVMISRPGFFNKNRAIFINIIRKFNELRDYYDEQFYRNVLRDSEFRLDEALSKLKKVKPTK